MENGNAIEDEREEELSTIAAIFPEIQLDLENPFAASLEIPVELPEPLNVFFRPILNEAVANTSPTNHESKKTAGIILPPPASQDIHSLQYFPPISLHVTLPEGYPADRPARFELKSHPPWIPQARLRSLEEEGNHLWEEYGRSQVVFAYIDFIKQAAEQAFEISTPNQTEAELGEDLKVALLDFDKTMQRQKFEQGTYNCGVCLEPKKGVNCHRMLRCDHVFCVPCLQEFYNAAIKEGDIVTVRCLEPSCGEDPAGSKKKKKPALAPSELLQIPLEYSVVKRYAELKRKKKLESDKTTIYCPRKWCQGPARSKKYPKITSFEQYESSDSEHDDEEVPRSNDKTSSSQDRLAICENCEFAFCRVCLAGWHGDLANCAEKPEDRQSKEEEASLKYIRLHTAACPTCSSPVQKTMGCNHMTCFQCQTHFCYICTSWLDSDNPYRHFNQPDTYCYMRLWELTEGDEGNNVHFNREGHPEPPAAPVGQQAGGAHEEAVPVNNQDAQAPAGDRLDEHRAPNDNLEPQGLPVVFNQLHVDDAIPAGRGRHGIAAADDARQRALHRFLQLAENDQEDEWDSDELEGDDLDFRAMEVIR